MAECRLRHGWRQTVHNEGLVIAKITPRQRKGLLHLGSIHPDCEEALQLLIGNKPVEAPLEGAELADALEMEQEALEELDEAEKEEEDEEMGDFENEE